MSPEQREFLNLVQRPARITAEQVSWLLGCRVHDIVQLIGAGLLRPLGRPGANAPKFFATIDIEQHMRDRKWLNRATDAIVNYWRSQNARRPERIAMRHPTNGKTRDLVGFTAGAEADGDGQEADI